MNENLIRMSSEWVNEAKNDLRNKLISLARETNNSISELSNVLAISRDELDQIMRGDGHISLLTFAKVLMATDNVIEIKPLSETPFADYDNIPKPSEYNDMSNNSYEDFDLANVHPFGIGKSVKPMEMTNEHEHRPNRIPYDGKPSTERCSRFQNVRPKQGCKRVKVNLDSLDKHELENIIRSNHWDREINIEASTRGDLINFLEFKEEMMNHVNPMAKQKTVRKESNDVERIKKFLINEVERNPQLRKIVNQYINENEQ